MVKGFGMKGLGIVRELVCQIGRKSLRSLRSMGVDLGRRIEGLVEWA